MATAVLLLALSQLPPGPLDAFRANYASIKAEMDFEFTGGAFKDARRLWDGQVPDYVEWHIPDSDLTIVGHWACDGAAEYFRFGSPEAVLDRASKDHLKREAGKVFYKVLFVQKTEALWDGEFLIGHQEHPHFRRPGGHPAWKIINVNAVDDEAPSYLAEGRGPLHWGIVFPHVLKFYDRTEPARRVLRWGHPTEVDVYRREQPDGSGWRQIEVSYDPAIGYLPRFVRSLSYYAPRDAAYSDEMFLIEARPCAAGGFVPTEWYNIGFEVTGFKSRYPHYNESTDLAPPTTQLPGGSRFRALNFRDFGGPVALTEARDAHSISAIGGVVTRPASVSSLTIDGVKGLLGKRMTTPAQRILPNIDVTELRELDRPAPGVWWPYLVALALAFVSAGGFLRWRRAAAGLSVLLIAGTATGCGMVGDPVVKLTAAYKETFVHIDPRTRELPMTLVVRNDGNRAIRLLRAGDGGCSCRRIDQSSLPATVGPGRMIALPVSLSIVPATMPQASQFQFETDRGVLGVSAPFYTLVGHELNPDNLVNNYMYEYDEWGFDLTHRAIYRVDGEGPATGLRFPGGFTAVRESVREGQVGGASDYAYRDTKYRLTLADRALGVHKAAISVVGPDGRTLLEAPVVWRRVPFLSSVPDRVVLGTRPVRVFLRCPDEEVELTRVLATPGGIKAVVSSPREVTVIPGERTPDVLEGAVEVGTTAQGRPPLRIPVVRYQTSERGSLTLGGHADR